MKSFLCFLLVLFSATNVFSADPLENEMRKLCKECLPQTVIVSDFELNHGGSGFIVRSEQVGNSYRNVVVTAAHLIHSHTSTVATVKYDGTTQVNCITKHKMILFAKDEESDLAIVLFESKKKMPTVEFDFDAIVRIGTGVFHIGFGMLDDARLDFGQVTQPKTYMPKNFKGNIRTNVYTIVGDSGGPLFLRSNHKVIGVCSSIRAMGHQVLPHQSYYTPITLLKTWDARANNALAFVYNPAETMPVLPFVKIKVAEYRYDLEEK